VSLFWSWSPEYTKARKKLDKHKFLTFSMQMACPCTTLLFVHLPIDGIINLIIESCHCLSFKFFQEFIESARFFASASDQGYEIKGRRVGSFFKLGSTDFPILRSRFHGHEMTFEQIRLFESLCKRIPVLELEDDWNSSLMHTFSVNERNNTWKKLMREPCSIPRTFDKFCDLMLNTIHEIIDDTLARCRPSVRYGYLHE
jgi:hypothetical protein